MGNYRTIIVPTGELAEPTLDAMGRLYLSYYDGSDAARFRSDLADKHEALLVYQDRELVGFTLYELYRECWRGAPVRVIYSGDTVVDRGHWGQQALAFAWISRAGQIKQSEPHTALFWFLIVKGHRTYRYLPTFSRTFHPHWSQRTDDLKGLADTLAMNRFGAAYDPASGVIRFSESRGHLKRAYAAPSQRESSKPSVSYFLQRNPDYWRGNELVCLCELSESNLKPLAQRLFSRP